MKKTLKTVISITLSLIMLLTALPVFAAENNTVASGECGENVKWTLDNTGNLTISGTGAIEVSSNDEDKPWYNYLNEIKNITITDKVSSICKYAFEGCDSIVSVTVSGDVNTIGAYAFAYCDSLESITINSPLKTLEHGAFSYCPKLGNIVLPDTVEKIGYWLLHGSEIAEDESNWENGALYIGNYLIYGYRTVGDYKIKEGTTVIADKAFDYNENITSVYMPDSVIYLGISAFYCDNLTSVRMSKNLKTIGETAFYSSQIREIEIPENVEVFNEIMLVACYQLEKIVFLNPETEIEIDTLTEAGSTFEKAVIYGYDNSTAQEYASLTGRNFVSLGEYKPHEHSYTSSETKPATCKESGVKTFTCECGDSYTEAIPVLTTHTFGNWTVVKPATYEEEGTEERICNICGKKESKTIAKSEYTDIAVTENESIKLFGTENVVSLPETTVGALLDSTKGNISVTDKDGKEVSKETPLASGMTVTLKDSQGKITDTKTVIIPCDNDGDGTVSSSDARTALRAAVGLDKLSDWQIAASDVEEPEKKEISSADARYILRAAVGLESVKDWLKNIK